MFLLVLVFSRRKMADSSLRQQVLELAAEQVQERLDNFWTQLVGICPAPQHKTKKNVTLLKP